LDVDLGDLVGLLGRVDSILEDGGLPLLCVAAADKDRVTGLMRLMEIPRFWVLVRSHMDPGECYIVNGQSLWESEQ
jgi:hypothetical protein